MRNRLRRRLSRVLEKYLLNPQLRFAIRRGLAPPGFALLETTGCRSGLLRRTPIGNGLDGDTFWLVAEHGRHCGWVRNLSVNPCVRVNVGGRWRSGTARPLPDDDGLARRRKISAAHGRTGRFDGWIFERTATCPLTIRIDLEPLTTPDPNATA